MPMNEDDVYTINLVAETPHNEHMINTLAFRVASVTNPEDEDTILSSLFNPTDGAFRARIVEPYSAVMSDAVRFIHWDVQKVDPVEMQPRRYLIGVTGQDATDTSTFNTACSATRYGDEGGRRNRGRIALFGLTDQQYQEGLIGAVSLALWQIVADAFVGTYSGAGGLFVLQLGFWVPAHAGIVGGVPTTYPKKFTHCKRTIVRESVRVQRSRTVGVGR